MEELDCPFCHERMNVKKGSGLLANDYLECESCEVSFIAIGKNKYQLKEYKEKTFLEKHKFTRVPYDVWVKIGEGEYTEKEKKEESELELKGTLNLNCPTCDTPFNKYHKGILNFDSIICPKCKARYEIRGNKFNFRNIPNKDSELWKYYDENLSIEEIYDIFNKKLEPVTENINEGLDCPFCHKKMNIRKGSGFLALDYLECESCEVSFTPSGKENYHLKDYKEKTFLEKHKNSYVPYDTWVKIGQGEYTEKEKKEESELEFVEKLDINCPTCETPFNKYHKKGMFNFDSIICPKCKARYEILTKKYRFRNIPDINSLLWEHYNEDLTLDEIYDIFGKSNDSMNNINENESIKNENIQEEKKNTEINNLKYCPKCNTKIIEGSKFCMECGTKLNPVTQNDEKIDENENREEELDDLLKREKEHFTKSSNKDYYFSEEAKIKGKEVYNDQKEYLKNNPTDFAMKGAKIHNIIWSMFDNLPPEEQKIVTLTGEGKYFEENEDYEKAVELYEEADNLTMQVCAKDIQELIDENGPGDYLYTAKIRQRIRVCKKKMKSKNKEESINLENDNQKDYKLDENISEVNEKEEELPVIKTENNVEIVDEFKEEMLSHNLIISDINCPSCGNNMSMYKESGLLSSSTYHYCEKCKIKFDGNENSLSIITAPKNTRFDKKLKFVHLPLAKWKSICYFGTTDDEIKKISELSAVESTPFTCPSCNHPLIECKDSGFRSSNYLFCTDCLLRLKIHKNDKYSLENTTDNYSPLWKHTNEELTFEEIQNIYKTDTSYLKERNEHLQRIKQRKNDNELFIKSIESGNVSLANPIYDTTVVLKKEERPIYMIDNVNLSEPRAVRVTNGEYGGASVRITKGVTLHSGRANSRSESHDEIKEIDEGDLLITNKRLIFLGNKRTTNIDLNKIIAITEAEDSISIKRSNKQKPEYFSNITRTQVFKVEDREIEATIDGTLLKKLIVGLI